MISGKFKVSGMPPLIDRSNTVIYSAEDGVKRIACKAGVFAINFSSWDCRVFFFFPCFPRGYTGEFGRYMGGNGYP